MEKNSFWVLNSIYSDLKEFHFSSLDFNFIAYYKDNKLLFVLDNTCDLISPNNLLLIESDGGNKWDSILKNKFKIDPMKIRPKENTKYKKLDVSYINLKIFEDFINTKTDNLYDLIRYLREDLSLKNAFIRESESLLVYNKTCKTLESSPETLEKLKKKVLSLSSKLQKNQKTENEGKEDFDEEMKKQLIQKLYDNAEKLKNTERRIKRANKRQENSKKELINVRKHIEFLKQKIALRKNSDGLKADFLYKKQELLTVENLNARNQQEEKESIKQKEFLEEDMVKETEKKVETVTEFKPPVLDVEKKEEFKLKKFFKTFFANLKSKKTISVPTAVETKVEKTKKISFLDSFKSKKFINYFVLFLVLVLIIVLGVFVFSDSNVKKTNVDERQIVEVVEDENIQNVEDKRNEKEDMVSDDLDTDKKSVEEVPAIQIQEKNSFEEFDDEESFLNGNKEKIKQDEPLQQPVLELKQVEVKKDVTPVKKQDKVSENKVKIVKPSKIDYEEKVEVDVKEEQAEEISEKLTETDIVRKGYVDTVLSGDKYLDLFSNIKRNFFTSEEKVDFKVLHEMNQLWNKFRNLSYNQYYNEGEILKTDINEREYFNDEHLLRIYVNAYNDMFESIINEFVNKYEYANGEAVDLYERIEIALNTLGKPSEKFVILEEIYNKIKKLGGSEVVLEAIIKKGEAVFIQNSEDIKGENLEVLESGEVIQSEDVDAGVISVYQKKDTEIDESIHIENVDSVPVSVIDQDYDKQDLSKNVNIENVKDVEDKTEVVEEKDSDESKNLGNDVVFEEKSDDVSKNVDNVENLEENEIVDSSKESEVIEYIGEEETD